MGATIDPAIVELATEATYRVSVVAGAAVIVDGEITLVARADGVGEFVSALRAELDRVGLGAGR